MYFAFPLKQMGLFITIIINSNTKVIVICLKFNKHLKYTVNCLQYQTYCDTCAFIIIKATINYYCLLSIKIKVSQ